MKNRSIERLFTAAVESVGYKLIPTWRLDGLRQVAATQRIFKRFAIETVLDVGANLGQFAGEFLRQEVGFSGRIISFEPVAASFSRLEAASAADPNWQVLPYALGAETGTLTINVAAGSKLSSFLDPSDAAPQQFREPNTTAQRETAQVRRLDDVIPPDIDISRTYLKLDTQGFDLSVARGATRTLPSIPALQTELSLIPLYNGMPHMRDALAFFEKRGFAVSDLFLVSQDETLRAVEFDCLMVRERAV
jgi:FkbM family methyltransferase